MMQSPTVLTIILNYKTADMTVQSVAAAVQAMKGIAGEITVVDNDSRDGSFEVISKAVQDNNWDQDNCVRVIQSGRNGGFGAGNNVGIRAGLSDGSKPDYVYVLNSDAFPEKTAIAKLLAYLQDHPETGFAGSYTCGQQGDPHFTAFRFPSIASELEGAIRFGPVSRLLKNHTVPLPLPRETCQVDWLAGASLMMRQSVLDDIGLFDETFFLYFEETDLCRRAAKAGWPTVYVRDSVVAHIGSVSTGMKNWERMPQYWFDSRQYYFTKNHGLLYASVASLAHILGNGLNRIRCILQRKPNAGPERFLRDLALHSIKSIGQSLFGAAKHPPRKTRPAGQESK